MKQYGKYIFPTHEKALEMLESLQSTEDNPCFHKAFGLLPEMTKPTIDENTGDILVESVSTGRFQLDVHWNFKEDESQPKEWEDFLVDLDRQGNHVVPGCCYLKSKL